ncbi:MAG: PEP-CTERM sorting domain-containing protein [Pirellulales bacterium]
MNGNLGALTNLTGRIISLTFLSRSRTRRLLARAARFSLVLLPAMFTALTLCASPAHGVILESWESQAATDPFTGSGDLTWTGDVEAWAITTESWPTSPAQDFAGERSLRSANHRSVEDGTSVVETVVTDIAAELDFSMPIEWNVFFSGNSVDINTSRRADFILLSDSSDPTIIEEPDDMMNGFKLSLGDPLFDATGNVPPSSHEGAALDDSLTLWRVDDTDDRWRVVGSIPLLGIADDDLNEGWNLRARLEPDGEWLIGFATGAIGQMPTLTSLGMDPGAPDFTNFAGSAFGGVGWLAPNNTAGDHDDFGFDNFSVASVPEPATWLLAILGAALLGIGRRFGR